MSIAEATPDLEVDDRNDRAFLGHPKGLGYLAFVEGCERFSYYSMQTLLTLYMVNYLLLPGRLENVVGLEWLRVNHYDGLSGQPLSSAIFGDYTSLVYLTPIIGGIIADRLTEVLQAGKLAQSHRLKLVTGHVAAGFRLVDAGIIVLGSHEIFHKDLLPHGVKVPGARRSSRQVESRAIDTFLDLTDGGVNKAFEALGNVKTADQIIQATRPGGTATIIGGLGKVPFTISDGSFTMQEIKIAGVALRRPTDVVEVLNMVRDKRIEVAGLISKRYRFDEINDAFHDLEAGTNLMGITVWN